MTAKMTYRTIVARNLIEKKCMPGDVLTLTLRNEESQENIYAQAQRLNDMFLLCYAFWPQSIAIHPDHLAILKKQQKSLDIVIPDDVAQVMRELVELAELPRRIALVADETLDHSTAVAHYHFRKEDAGALLVE